MVDGDSVATEQKHPSRRRRPPVGELDGLQAGARLLGEQVAGELEPALGAVDRLSSGGRRDQRGGGPQLADQPASARRHPPEDDLADRRAEIGGVQGKHPPEPDPDRGDLGDPVGGGELAGRRSTVSVHAPTSSGSYGEPVLSPVPGRSKRRTGWPASANTLGPQAPNTIGALVLPTERGAEEHRRPGLAAW